LHPFFICEILFAGIKNYP